MSFSAATALSSTKLYVTCQREFFIDNLLVRIHFIVVMIRWTGLATWEFEFFFLGSLTSTFLENDRRTWWDLGGGGELVAVVEEERLEPREKVLLSRPPLLHTGYESC